MGRPAWPARRASRVGVPVDVVGWLVWGEGRIPGGDGAGGAVGAAGREDGGAVGGGTVALRGGEKVEEGGILRFVLRKDMFWVVEKSCGLEK